MHPVTRVRMIFGIVSAVLRKKGIRQLGHRLSRRLRVAGMEVEAEAEADWGEPERKMMIGIIVGS